MVSSASTESVSLADVVPSCLSALGWNTQTAAINLAPCETLVLFLIDGLGTRNIESARGYLRFISAGTPVHSNGRTVFPSTTASALSSLVTGVAPEVHGITGYRAWDEATGQFVNQLNGLTFADIDSGWMRAPSLLSQAAVAGHSVCVIGHPRFEGSALTRMLYRHCTYVGARSVEDKVSATISQIQSGRSGLFLVYISDLDEAAHQVGIASDDWVRRAEELDAQVRRCVTALGASVQVVLTADHGVVDVPSSRHIEFGSGPEMDGVLAVGGEPRCLQIKVTPESDIDEIMATWRQSFGEKIRVVQGALDVPAAVRVPDFYVHAPEGHAFYDSREPESPARKMVGQHGGQSEVEMAIPLLVWSS